MPIGGFLDSFPTALFIGAHIVFLLVGLWAFKQARDAKQGYAPALWLYIASQPVFIGFFAGIITLKMAVLTEQTLLVIMMVWIAAKARSAKA
ncbi:MAG: hypothetical protein HY687_01230 [Chloroflexi bacterium]|nr:hypothetical protein [Chloroflexota bacterium]